MFTLIKIDLKQRIKNPLTWFVIMILFIMSMLNIIELNESRLNRAFSGHHVAGLDYAVSPFNWSQFIDEREKQLFPKAYYSYKLLDKTEADIVEAKGENNIKEITRLMAFYNLLFAKAGYVTNDAIMSTVFKNKAIEIWNDVSDGVPYEDVDFYPEGEVFDDGKYKSLLYAKYYHSLYKNDLEPIYSDDVNNVTYLYYYFFNIATKFIIIIPIFFIYNIINKDKNTGSLKLILTQSISRRKYYMGKWISGVIHVIFVFLFPPVIISTILGTANGFVSMKYPVIYLRDSMTSFKTIPNYFDAIKAQAGYYPQFWFTETFNYYAPSHKVITHPGHFFPNHRMEIIPFYKYLLMVILLTVLFTAFAVALVQLISAIIDKEIISFVVATLVFVIGTITNSPFKQDKNLNLSPFTMEHASRIVIGTYNVTALGSILILLASTILLLIIGCRYFKKKAI